MPSARSRQQNRKSWQHYAYWRLSMLKILYLAIFSLKVDLSRFPRFQLGGLKVFYCVTSFSVVSGFTRSDGNYTARRHEVPTAPHLLGWQQSCLTRSSHHFRVFCHCCQNPIVESSARGHVHILYSYGYGVDTQCEWLHYTLGRTIGMMARKI
jgi:hypothetical protein